MVTLVFLISLLLLLEGSDLEKSDFSTRITSYNGKEYKYIKYKTQGSDLECEIPPHDEEDLTHYRRKRMIALRNRVCQEDYPYTMSVRVNDTHVCTGALIHYQYALSVSDCVKDVEYPERLADVSLRLGSSFRDAGGYLVSVAEIFFHPKNGTDGDYSHRLIILKMNLFITPTNRMMPLVLPYPRMKVPKFGQLLVTGYGNNNETGKWIEFENQWIRRTFVTALPYEECLTRIDLNQTNGIIDGEFYDDYICIERVNLSALYPSNNETEDELYLCTGDMGVPLVHFSQKKYTPIILGLSLTAMEDCLNETLNKGVDGQLKPGIFLYVPEYVGWIHMVLKNELAKEEEGERSSPTECELYPSFDVNMRYYRRRKRLTTETDMACLEDYPYTVSVSTSKEDVTVRMGSVFRDYGGKIVSVISLVKHPQYKKGDKYPANNLAMLQINMPIIPTVRVQIVRLIPPITVRVGQWGGENVVTGYGSVTSTLLEEGVNQELRRMKVKRLPISDCQKAYEGITEIKQDHVCLKSSVEGVNLCTGDLGNPAVQFTKYSKDGTLFALAMFPGDEGCNSSRPALFTKIRPSRKWIDTILREGPPPITEPPPTTKVPVWQVNYTEYFITSQTYCHIHPTFELDLRHVNLTATRRRRKRMTFAGKGGLTCLEDYPQTVAILKDFKEVICSGVIVARQWVLTAAMCFERCSVGDCQNLTSVYQLAIRMGSIFGSKGGRLLPVIDLRINPEYKKTFFYWKTHVWHPDGNLAMLKFNIPYRPSARMQRVMLPKHEMRHGNEFVGRKDGRFIVVGFSGGKRSGQPEDGFNDILATEVVALPNHYCVHDHRNGTTRFAFSDHLNFCWMIKEPNVTFCAGDIGMPLLHFTAENSKPVLIGIHAFYPPPNVTKGICLPARNRDNNRNMPGVFVKVGYYVDWIKRILEEDEKDPLLFYRRPRPMAAVKWFKVP